MKTLFAIAAISVVIASAAVTVNAVGTKPADAQTRQRPRDTSTLSRGWPSR
jgi:hypothetical protein